MTVTPQFRWIGDLWTIAVQFNDPSGAPLTFPTGLVPAGEFFIATTNQVIDLTETNGRVQVSGSTTGLIYYTLDKTITDGIVPIVGALGLASASDLTTLYASKNFPFRIQAFLTDSSGNRTTYSVTPVIPVDPETTDLTVIPAPTTVFVTVGPAGPAGATGTPGSTGPTGPTGPAINGALLGRQVFTSSGTYTPTPGTTVVDVTAVGGGGAGGGTPSTTSGQASVGGGGAAGAVAKKRLTAGFSGASVTIGGAGVGASGAAGGSGGDTTFGYTSPVVAHGGAGGQLGGTAVPGVTGGAVGGTATGGDLNIAGQNGSGAAVLSSTVALSGPGGASLLGSGGVTKATLSGSDGNPAAGYGAGGSGSAATASQAAHTGGAGTGGFVEVLEYR